MPTRILRLIAIFFLFAAAIQRPQAERIVAIGDVHGNLDGFISILQAAGLINENLRWSGGNSTLVQLGDLIDRGPRSRDTLDFVIDLQNQAANRGGSVRISLGNHEVMNVLGDMRYVVPSDYAAFADNRSEQRRRRAFQDYSKLQGKNGIAVDEEAWMKAHPLGFIEHREAFGPQGKYGKWLRDTPAVVQIGDSVFLHAGINPALDPKSIDQFNTGIRNEIRLFDQITRYMTDKGFALPFFTFEEFASAASAEVEKTRLIQTADQTDEERTRLRVLEGLLQAGGWLSVHDDGPLWFRGYDRWSDEEGESRILPLMRALGVTRFVVAHTPQRDGQIRSRFGGRVFLIDTGLVIGRPSALEILSDQVRAIYMTGRADLN